MFSPVLFLLIQYMNRQKYYLFFCKAESSCCNGLSSKFDMLTFFCILPWLFVLEIDIDILMCFIILFINWLISMCVFECVSLCLYLRVLVYVHIFVCYFVWIFVCVNSGMHMCVLVSVYLCVCVCVCVCVCECVCVSLLLLGFKFNNFCLFLKCFCFGSEILQWVFMCLSGQLRATVLMVQCIFNLKCILIHW